MKPAQKRSGFASDSSHDSQEVAPGDRAAAQLDSRTLLPAPADPTTTVRRRSAPAISWSCRADLGTSVAGNCGGRNFVAANRALGEPPRPAATPFATNTPPEFPPLRR